MEPKQSLSRLYDTTTSCGQVEGLLSDCRQFLNAERWYGERGIPYRRGYLLHGPPGTGKTSLVFPIFGSSPLFTSCVFGLFAALRVHTHETKVARVVPCALITSKIFVSSAHHTCTNAEAPPRLGSVRSGGAVRSSRCRLSCSNQLLWASVLRRFTSESSAGIVPSVDR